MSLQGLIETTTGAAVTATPEALGASPVGHDHDDRYDPLGTGAAITLNALGGVATTDYRLSDPRAPLITNQAEITAALASDDELAIHDLSASAVRKTPLSRVITWLVAVLQDGTRALRLGGADNYAEFAADGTLRLVGTATTYDDLVGGIAAAVTSGPGVSLNNAEQTLDFVASANLSDYAWLAFQLEHRWKAGSVIYPHLHWEQAAAQSPNWLIQYRWQRQGQEKTTAWSNYKANTPAFTWTTATLDQISYGAGIAAPTGYGISDILQVRLLRDSANASGLFTGADAYAATARVTSFDIHIECDALGSATEYVK